MRLLPCSAERKVGTVRQRFLPKERYPADETTAGATTGSHFYCDAESCRLSLMGEQAVEREFGVVLHRFGDDVAVVALDLEAAFEQAIHQPLVSVDVGDDDLHDVVDAATGCL